MNRVRACLYLSVFVIMGLSDTVIPILPVLSRGDTITQSMLFSAYFAGALIMMIPLGMLSDRYGSPPFISLSIILTLISGAMLLYFDDPALLISARFIEGCACSAFFPAAFSMLIRFKGSKRYIGEFNFLLNSGLAIGVGTAAVLMDYYLKGGILVFCVLALPALAMSLSLKNARDHITQVPAPDTMSQAPTQTPTAPHVELSTVLFDPQYLQMWIVSFVLFGGTGVLVAYFPSYTDISTSLQGLALTGVYFGSMVTSLICGRLHITEKRMIRTGITITSAGIATTVIHPIGLTIMGAGSGFALVGLVTGAATLNQKRGMTMGAFNTYTYAGFTVMPMLAAGILGYLDYAGLFLVTGAALMTTLLFPLNALKGRR
ncbi:MAG: MFS transporter [Methanosarcinales archaeon]|nr:MAG: MFS transporter [Methanosarcinales archaeon]